MHEYDIYEAVTSMRNHTVRMDREGDYWTEEEKEQLVKLFREGEGITAIAIRLQRTEPAIMQQIEKTSYLSCKARILEKPFCNLKAKCT